MSEADFWEPQSWKQERPTWCPHSDCVFLRRTMDSACGGRLPKPEPHGAAHNTHRLCMRTAADDSPPNTVYPWQVNFGDLGWLRWILDAIDGQVTSWISKAAKEIGGDGE